MRSAVTFGQEMLHTQATTTWAYRPAHFKLMHLCKVKARLGRGSCTLSHPWVFPLVCTSTLPVTGPQQHSSRGGALSEPALRPTYLSPPSGAWANPPLSPRTSISQGQSRRATLQTTWPTRLTPATARHPSAATATVSWQLFRSNRNVSLHQSHAHAGPPMSLGQHRSATEHEPGGRIFSMPTQNGQACSPALSPQAEQCLPRGSSPRPLVGTEATEHMAFGLRSSTARPLPTPGNGS